MKNKSRLDGKRILITGVAGTVGMALVETLKDSNAKSIAGLDNNEASLFEAEQSTNVEFSPILCDIRDRPSLEKSCRNTDIIFHLAALKHVPLCEKNPL